MLSYCYRPLNLKQLVQRKQTPQLPMNKHHVPQSIPSDPSMYETEDSEEVFSPNFPACSASDCVIAEPKRATSTTMTPVPDSMELIESCDSASTTPTKNHPDKERDD